MDRVRRFRQGVANILIACAAFVGALVGLLKDALELGFGPDAAPFLSDQSFALAAAIFFVMLLGFLAFGAAYVLFDRWRPLRKVVMGRQYIEGFWFDAMLDAGGRPAGYGYILITLVDDDLRVEGWSLNDAGKEVGHFVSSATQYDGFVLSFIYSKVNKTDLEDLGVARYVFSATDGYPHRYDGDFVSRRSGFVRTTAIRVEDQDVLQALRRGRMTGLHFQALIRQLHDDLGLAP